MICSKACYYTTTLALNQKTPLTNCFFPGISPVGPGHRGGPVDAGQVLWPRPRHRRHQALQEGAPRRGAGRSQDAQQGRKEASAATTAAARGLNSQKVTAAKAQFKFRAPILITGKGHAVISD